jgi:hypothetical protein
MPELTSDQLFEPDTVAGLLHRAPEGGVLSIYVDAGGGADPGLQGAAIDIRNRLAELQRNVGAEGPPERAAAVADALRRLGPEIERLTSPHGSGRGRVLFAAVGDGDVIRFAGRMPVANRVVLDDSAFVHPLLELLDEGRPAGVVLGSLDEARLLEWRLGELDELDRLAPETTEAPYERSGPVGSSPAERAGSPKSEQRAARERRRMLRFLDRVGGAATALAGERDWERMLVSGGERWTEPLAQAIAARLQDGLIRDARVLTALDRAALSETVTERLTAEHAAREQRLVRAVRDTALGRGAAALGLSDVVGALNEGRVAHLVYDPEIRYHGSIGAGGLLHAGDERPGDTAATPAPEPRLTERLVERALETGARVTPVEGAARAALGEAGGIAALLRW